MDGVTVLQVIPPFAESISLWTIILCMALLAISIIITNFISPLNKARNIAIIAEVVCGVILLIVLLLFSAKHPTQYKVTVDDSVSYIKLYTKYNIINIEDKIITIQLKEN